MAHDQVEMRERRLRQQIMGDKDDRVAQRLRQAIALRGGFKCRYPFLPPSASRRQVGIDPLSRTSEGQGIEIGGKNADLPGCHLLPEQSMQRQCQHWRFVPGLTAYRPDPQRLPLPTRLRQDPGQEVIFQVVEPWSMSKESRLHTSIPFPPVIDQLSILHSGKQTAQLSRHASPLACQVQRRPGMRATNNTADEEQSHIHTILPRKRDDVNKQALRTG